MRKDVIKDLGIPDDSLLVAPIQDLLDQIANDDVMPDTAIAVCTLRADEAAPALRAVLTKAADGFDLTEPEATLNFRGLHILGGARDSEAWPALLRLLKQPGDRLDDLLGDTITQSLPGIAAGLFHGDVDGLLDLVADETVDEFVRQTLFGTAAFLTWDGWIDRTRMAQFLKRFYEDRLAESLNMAWIGWLEAIALLGLRDLAPLVHHAWDEGLILDDIMERHDFEDDLVKAEQAPDDIERFKAFNLGYIEDVLASLDWTRNVADEDREPFGSGWEVPEPVRNPWRHVGRNDPCPCGSGKKAKKCCLATG